MRGRWIRQPQSHWAPRDWLLLITVLWLAAAISLVWQQGTVVRDEWYDTKLAAAHSMERSMEAIKIQKELLGLTMDAMDYHRTGMLGASYTPITTTLGAPESKRTSAHGDMAALVVELLHQAQVQPGDRVGAVFSGSFPSLNLAVLAACRELEADCVYIASIGSSTYGANQPELTFPDMAALLTRQGLVAGRCLAVTPGGDRDVGAEMDPQVLDEILSRIEGYGFPILIEPDYSANLQARISLLEQEGPLDCFVNVGGNITSMGRGESAYYLGQGLLTGEPAALGPGSGLIELYHASNIPVIHLLNLKKLTAEYSLPYDPPAPPLVGTTALYYTFRYSRWLSLLLFAPVVPLLVAYGIQGKREKAKALRFFA